MKNILQLLGGILLAYSVAGVALHALANLESFGHHCEMLLFSLDENHLQVFTISAALAALFFFMAKAVKKRGLRKAI